MFVPVVKEKPVMKKKTKRRKFKGDSIKTTKAPRPKKKASMRAPSTFAS